MQGTGSQTGLKVMSIINIVLGAFLLLTSLSTYLTRAALLADPQIVSELQEIMQADEAMAGPVVGLVAVAMLIMGIFMIAMGILGLRGAKTPGKVKPAWILSLIWFIVIVLSILMSFGQSGGPSAVAGQLLVFILSGGLSAVVGQLLVFILPALTFWFANGVKGEAAESETSA